MSILFPYRVRATLYIITSIGTPIMGYLLSKEIIGVLEMGLWTAEVGIVAGMAAFNTNPSAKEEAAEKLASSNPFEIPKAPPPPPRV